MASTQYSCTATASFRVNQFSRFVWVCVGRGLETEGSGCTQEDASANIHECDATVQHDVHAEPVSFMAVEERIAHDDDTGHHQRNADDEGGGEAGVPDRLLNPVHRTDTEAGQ